MKKIFSILLFLPLWVVAQTWQYRQDTSVKVYAYGQQQTLAWCGGFNNPQFTMGDLNNDGLQDLVVYEAYNSIRTFINTGTPGNPHYTYAPEYELNFPPVSGYLILADYNCDSIPDLFEQGSYGFAVYTGYYNSSNQLCFRFYQNLFYYDTASGWANAFNNPGTIPAIVDVDGDGDLDFITTNILGGGINYYKNMQVELGLPCDSIHIALASTGWGKFNLPGPGNNSPCLFDYKMNGEYDCLIGNVSPSVYTMRYYQNGRIQYDPTGPDSMVSEDTTWQSNGTIINLPSAPVAFNIDINQDGKKDLLISPGVGPNCMNYNNIWYYENLSTPDTPNWQFQSDSFLIDQSIDLGTAAYPVLFDYNNDGLPDLFIGSDGYTVVPGTNILLSMISYYKNTSTPGNPSFTLQTNDFMGLSAYNWAGAYPAIGDIDNDGTADLIIGHTDGTLSYFKNTAASSMTPNWVLQEMALTDVNGDTINVNNSGISTVPAYATPFIYDIDKDGKNDLVIGEAGGYLQYYRNVSTTAGAIALKLITTELGHITTGENSAPFIGKIDNTGVDYLLMCHGKSIYQYDSVSSGDTGATYGVADTQYSYVDTFQGMPRGALAIGNIAGDSSLYMLVGNYKGGVELFKASTANLQTQTVGVKGNNEINIFPNPASTVLTVQSVNEPISNVSISNVVGQIVVPSASLGTTGFSVTVDVSGLPAGVYFVKVSFGLAQDEVTTVRKFVKE